MLSVFRKDRSDNSMRSLTYFVDVLAIIAFMYILQAKNNAAVTESVLQSKDLQLAQFEEQLEAIQQFDPQQAIEQRRQQDLKEIQEMQETLAKVQTLYEEKEQTLTEYQQLVAKLHQQSTMEMQSVKAASSQQLQTAVAQLEQEKSEIIQQKDTRLQETVAQLEQEKSEIIQQKDTLDQVWNVTSLKEPDAKTA
ncbi:MAG: hypothetical protein VX610_00160 [SAR324 cluster bacterium]|nr:hypothetical protein [SAR324 cluster bacterium]